MTSQPWQPVMLKQLSVSKVDPDQAVTAGARAGPGRQGKAQRTIVTVRAPASKSHATRPCSLDPRAGLLAPPNGAWKFHPKVDHELQN